MLYTLLLLLCFSIFKETHSEATKVWGQDDFTKMTNNGVTRSIFSAIIGGLDIDRNEGLFISDSENNRILYYATQAQYVLGQGLDYSNFTSKVSNFYSRGSALTPNDLSYPTILKVDPQNDGAFYVCDYGNSRVLHFPSIQSSADRIYGDGIAGISKTTIRGPAGIAIASDGGVYIADQLVSSSRILYYARNTTATRVYGQNGDFTADLADNLFSENIGGIAVDASGLYVSDCEWNRVLFIPKDETTPTRVYGQNNNMTRKQAPSLTNADSLSCPEDVVIDRAGNVYIAERDGRVLFYLSPSTTASRVYGKDTMVTNVYTGPTANSFKSLFSIALSSSFFYAADSQGPGSRILAFPLVLSAPSPTEATPGLSTIAIAGIAVGAAVGLSVLIGMAVFYCPKI